MLNAAKGNLNQAWLSDNSCVHSPRLVQPFCPVVALTVRSVIHLYLIFPWFLPSLVYLEASIKLLMTGPLMTTYETFYCPPPRAWLLSGEVTEVLDPAGAVGLVERSQTLSRHILSLGDFSAPCGCDGDRRGNSPHASPEYLVMHVTLFFFFLLPFFWHSQTRGNSCNYGLFNSRLKVINMPAVQVLLR